MGNVESNVTRNEEVPSSHQHGFSPIYRAIGQRTLDESIDGKLFTVRDIIEDTVNKYGSNPGLGNSYFIQALWSYRPKRMEMAKMWKRERLL